MIKKFPQHVAIIPDGNRRYAKAHKLPLFAGHIKGIETLEKLATWCLEKTPIKYMTVYALSTENVNRSFSELNALFSIYEEQFKRLVSHPFVHKNKIRINIIGNLNLLPEKVSEAAKTVMERTKDYTGRVFTVALGYGGREELIRMVKNIAKKVLNGFDIEKINENLIRDNLYTNGIPYPELVIRTSERRLSNFLLWQSAYSEFVFIDKFFPEMTIKDFKDALKEYDHRERRFGR